MSTNHNQSPQWGREEDSLKLSAKSSSVHRRARTHKCTPFHKNTLQRTSFSSSGLAQRQSSNRWVFITVSCAAVPGSPNKLACAPNRPSGGFMCLMNNKGSGVVCQAAKNQLNSRAEKRSVWFQLYSDDKTQNRHRGCWQPSCLVPSLKVDGFVFSLRDFLSSWVDNCSL